MAALIMLVTISLLLALGFLLAFWYSVRRGQFDDAITPAMRVLADDEPAANLRSEESKINGENLDE